MPAPAVVVTDGAAQSGMILPCGKAVCKGRSLRRNMYLHDQAVSKLSARGKLPCSWESAGTLPSLGRHYRQRRPEAARYSTIVRSSGQGDIRSFSWQLVKSRAPIFSRSMNDLRFSREGQDDLHRRNQQWTRFSCHERLKY
jgi:hypothetical protein